MDGQCSDERWVLAVAVPEPWRALSSEVGQALGLPLLEAAGEPQAVAAAGRGRPVVALVFLDAASRPGYRTVSRLKEARPGLPVVALVRGGREAAALAALERGADDILRLPVAPADVVARLRATLRRLREEERGRRSAGEQPITLGALHIDLGRREVQRDGRRLRLTDTEFDLLALLADRAGGYVSREGLLNRLCRYDYDLDSRVIDVHVRNLRRKVEVDPAQPAIVRAVPGVGYCVAQTLS